MSQLLEIIKDLDMSGGPIDVLGDSVGIGSNGKVHIQAHHTFDNENVKLYPLVSVDGVHYDTIEKNGERVEISLSGSVNSIIISDLLLGSRLKIGIDFGGGTEGLLTVKILI